MVLETLVYSAFNHLKQLLAEECFIEFSHLENFELNINIVSNKYIQLDCSLLRRV
jgi:hypothetical protein